MLQGSSGSAKEPPARRREREFFIDNLLVRIHFIIVMIRWTGLAPWEFEFPRRKHATRITAARTSARFALALAVCLLTLHRAGGTEDDAKMAAGADSWLTVASHFQKSGDTLGASRAARTCVRLADAPSHAPESPPHGQRKGGASLPCHDLLARLLAAGVAPPGVCTSVSFL